MGKKFSLLIAAVAALALAVPATAAASTGLTSPTGTLVPVGTVIVGTNTSTFTMTATGVGTLTCNNVELRGEVTADSSAGISFNSGKQTSIATGCFRNGSTAITLNEIKLESVNSSPSEPTTGKITASYVTHNGNLNCKYQLTNDTFTYTNNGDSVKLEKQPQTVTPAACGAGGNLDFAFTVETAAKASVIIMS